MRGVQRGSAPTHIDFNNKGVQAYRERTLSNVSNSSSLKSPAIPYSTVIASPGLVPAVTPTISGAAIRASPLMTPLIQLQSINKEGGLSPIPQSPVGMNSGGDATPMPYPGGRRAATTDDSHRENDYFSLRSRQPSKTGVPATPDESGANASGVKTDGPMSPTPQTPSAGGFMGRLKKIGRAASSRGQSESSGVPATPGGSSAPTPAEVDFIV